MPAKIGGAESIQKVNDEIAFFSQPNHIIEALGGPIADLVGSDRNYRKECQSPPARGYKKCSCRRGSPPSFRFPPLEAVLKRVGKSGIIP